MKFKVTSTVTVPGIGNMGYTHEQHFDNDSNVFGRVLEYRQYMQRMFPGCKFKMEKAERMKDNGKEGK